MVLVEEAIKIVQPTVVLLLGRDKSSNVSQIHKNNGTSRREVASIIHSDAIKMSSPHAKIEHVYFENNAKCRCLSTSSIRKMSITCHFVQSCPDPTIPLKILDDFDSVANSKYWSLDPPFSLRQPYIIPFSGAQLRLMNFRVSHRLVGDAIKGTIVALSTEAMDKTLSRHTSSEIRCIFPAIDRAVAHQSIRGNVLGLGLVRGVNANASLMYIVTPPYIPHEDLRSVCTFIRSSYIETPLIMLTCGSSGASDTFIPYTTRALSSDVKGVAANSRLNLLRKKHKLDNLD